MFMCFFFDKIYRLVVFLSGFMCCDRTRKEYFNELLSLPRTFFLLISSPFFSGENLMATDNFYSSIDDCVKKLHEGKGM